MPHENGADNPAFGRVETTALFCVANGRSFPIERRQCFETPTAVVPGLATRFAHPCEHFFVMPRCVKRSKTCTVSSRATCRIAEGACLIRWIGVSDFDLKALRRNRGKLPFVGAHGLCTVSQGRTTAGASAPVAAVLGPFPF